MTRLLVQSCSKTKNTAREPKPALDVYDGYFFNIINKAVNENALRPDLELCILSAKHGVIRPDDRITDYNRKMTADRAEAIGDKVTNSIEDLVEDSEATEVILNVGKDYYPAIEGLEERLDLPVIRITGNGIGEKGKSLKKFLRGQVNPSTMEN